MAAEERFVAATRGIKNKKEPVLFSYSEDRLPLFVPIRTRYLSLNTAWPTMIPLMLMSTR